MLRARGFVALAVAAWATLAWGQTGMPTPHVGYVFPAGGQVGTTFRVTVGGQYLMGASGVHVTGTGVQGKVIEFVRPLTNKQLADAAAHIRLLVEQKLAEARGGPFALRVQERLQAKAKELDPLPNHPLFRDLDKKSVQELEELRQKLFDPKRQMNAQIAETVIVELTIDGSATPGDRELRLVTRAGLTNPLRFQVGQWPEVMETEPNDQDTSRTPLVTPPAVLNGQIMPGDVDRFRLKLKEGQNLVVRVQARALVPYLADAVPGWFQSTVALRSADGTELAYADDYRSDPDPVLFFRVPRDGEYLLEIKDAIYRGREDFVYRVTVGEQPFVTSIFPLGGREGVPTLAAVTGWNLPWQQVVLDTTPGPDKIRQSNWRYAGGLSNTLPYAVDSLPETTEVEPNDSTDAAQRVVLPQIINGRIGRPGDVDLYRIEGKAGEEVVAEVMAHRLGSPLDSLLRLVDAAGNVVAWNDDCDDKSAGLETHHADSYLRAKLPQDGAYWVRVSDTQGHGGEEWGYRLRISAPQPDFDLRIVPSSLNLLAGRTIPISVTALRKDGFAGDITVRLKNAPPGVVLSGGRIPGCRDTVRMTLTAPAQPSDVPLALELEGTAQVAGKTVTRRVVPAEDMMQAFAYRHLVPAQQLVALVLGARRAASVPQLVGSGPVKIPAGGTAQVRFFSPAMAFFRDSLHLELSDPPPGVTLQEVQKLPLGVALVLKADKDRAGYADNLIVSMAVETEIPAQGKQAARKQRFSLGVLPAIEFDVVGQ
jgi:hypothetical protein